MQSVCDVILAVHLCNIVLPWIPYMRLIVNTLLPEHWMLWQLMAKNIFQAGVKNLIQLHIQTRLYLSYFEVKLVVVSVVHQKCLLHMLVRCTQHRTSWCRFARLFATPDLWDPTWFWTTPRVIVAASLSVLGPGGCGGCPVHCTHASSMSLKILESLGR